MRDINTNVFDEIQCRVCRSFLAVTASGVPNLAQANRPFPIITHSALNQLLIGLILISKFECSLSFILSIIHSFYKYNFPYSFSFLLVLFHETVIIWDLLSVFLFRKLFALKML